uniref:Uncharacterized protein n=1 Tax=Rhizophagus irregularis (strain DAOM 181602 / DAOM 197198 / MUCL 43194) TaxID=747089 RepID=U9SVX9_RHIID
MMLTNFTKFNSTKYNSLPEVNVASRILQQHPNFAELLGKIYFLTKAHSIELGVQLIYRHMQVDEVKVMIEKFQFHQNASAFITSVSFPTDQVYPASWLLEDDGKLTVFEYSIDILVKRTFEKLIKNPSIFVEICDLIRDYHFENLLAPCITARDSLKHFEKENGFMETTDFKSNASIVKNMKNSQIVDDKNAIINTMWAYSVSDNCFGDDNHCPLHCRHCLHCDSVDPEDGLDTEGVVGCEVFLRLGFPQGIFEVVPDPEVFADDDATFGLGIFDGCDLLGILGDVTLLPSTYTKDIKSSRVLYKDV